MIIKEHLTLINIHKDKSKSYNKNIHFCRKQKRHQRKELRQMNPCPQPVQRLRDITKQRKEAGQLRN
jgi:hypothetical protein